MARAGYCSTCGNYVFLRPDGGCANGHGQECVSNPYDVPDAGAAVAQPAAYQAPQYAAPGAYAPPAYPTEYPAPVVPAKKKRTALIIAIVVIAFLLLCCCAGVIIAATRGLIPNPLVSAEHQKVAVAGDFLKALGTADAIGLVKTIPSEAAAAADAKFWLEALAEAESGATLKSASWDGDVLTQVYTDRDGGLRTAVFTAIEGDRVQVTMTEEGADSGDAAIITMVKEATGWKVLALGTEDSELIRFDAETVRMLQESGD